MKKSQSTFEYRLNEATEFEDNKGRSIVLPPNTRMVYGGYDNDGMGTFTVVAGKENGRKLQTEGVPAAAFRGGAAPECRSCGAALDDNNRSVMVPDVCTTCEDAGDF